MKRSVTILTITIISMGFNSPVLAQWDLGGIPANTAQSAGGGQGGYRDLNANGSLQQPYNNQPSYQTIYNNQLQQGLIQNIPYSTIPGQYNRSSQLTGTSMPALSPMQEQGLLGVNHLPKGTGQRGGLPNTTLDSFVHNAGGAAARIYGDEGTNSWPPMNGFPESSSINAGIVGLTNKTLTTGHGSKLPSPSQVSIHGHGDPMSQSGAR